MFDSNIITIFIGFGLFTLGWFRVTNFVNLEPKYLFSFSMAAFLLILSDLCGFLFNKFNLNKKEKSNYLKIFKVNFIAMSAMAIMILPHLPFSWNNELYLKLSDGLALCGLGISVIIIGLKTNEVTDVTIAMMKGQVEMISELTELLKSEQNKVNNLYPPRTTE